VDSLVFPPFPAAQVFFSIIIYFIVYIETKYKITPCMGPKRTLFAGTTNKHYNNIDGDIRRSELVGKEEVVCVSIFLN